MTYATREKSVHSGRPFEVYRFSGPMGVFRYTSLPYAVTVDGEVYEPMVITRTAIAIGSIIDSPQTMDFSMPADCVLAEHYMDRYTPDYLHIKVMRAHEGDAVNTDFSIEWQGQASAYSVSDNWFTVQTVSILQAKILGACSTAYYQYACNHIVYDELCKASKAAHTVSVTVTHIDNVVITVNTAGYPSGELQLGTMRLDRTEEERSIVSNVGRVITVSYPFLDLKVGDIVKLVKGCDNRMTTCVSRFDNVRNFGGFRFIPVDNPMGGR